MAFVPNGFVNEQQIESGVQRASLALAPAVVRIRYSLGHDWTGDPSIFFRVVFADEVAKKRRLGEVAETVSSVLRNEVKPDELGLHAYFTFRSLSELATLNEPAWA